MSENKVEVQIDGIAYTLITDESEDHIKEIAQYVERKIHEVKGKRLGIDRQLVLASLNIADDLFSVGNKYSALKEETKEYRQNYPDLVNKYKKAIEQNEDLLARIEDIIARNNELADENENLKREIKSLKTDENSSTKLRSEIKRLQEELITYKAENEQLKDNI